MTIYFKERDSLKKVESKKLRAGGKKLGGTVDKKAGTRHKDMEFISLMVWCLSRQNLRGLSVK